MNEVKISVNVSMEAANGVAFSSAVSELKRGINERVLL